MILIYQVEESIKDKKDNQGSRDKEEKIFLGILKKERVTTLSLHEFGVGKTGVAG